MHVMIVYHTCCCADTTSITQIREGPFCSAVLLQQAVMQVWVLQEGKGRGQWGSKDSGSGQGMEHTRRLGSHFMSTV